MKTAFVKHKLILLMLMFLAFKVVICVAQEHPAMNDAQFHKYVSDYRKKANKANRNLELHRQLIEKAHRMNLFSVSLHVYKKSFDKNPDHPVVLYALAYTYLTEGTRESLNGAVKYFKAAIKTQPDFADAHAALGRCYLLRGQKKLALEQLRKSIELDPEFAPAYLDLARYYRSEVDYESAIENYRRSLNLDPRSALGHFELGLLYFDRADIITAGNEFSQAIRYDSTLAKAYYKLGQVKVLQGEPSAAIELYKQGREYAPKDAKSRYELANVFLDVDNGRYAIWSLRSALALQPKYADEVNKLKDVSTVDAAEIIKDILARQPGNPDLHHFLGKLEAKLGNKEEAQEHLETAKKLEPADEEVRADLAEIYEEQNEPEKAKEEYEQAVKLDATQFQALSSLVDTYKKDRNEEKFIEAAERLVAASPARSNLRYELAAIYERKAQKAKDKAHRTALLDKAVKHCKAAADSEAHNIKYLLKLAHLYSQQGKIKAMRAYEQVLEIDENSDEAYLGRGMFMLTYAFGARQFLLYRPEDIMADLKKALELNPKSADAHYAMGVVYDRMGLTNKAMAEFEKTVELDKKNSKAYLYLAEKYANSGRHQQAINAFKKASEVETDNVEALKDFAFLTLKYNEKDGWQDANAALKRVLELKPDDAEALMNYAYTLYLGKNFPEAITNYLRSLKVEPNSARTRYNLALAYEANGQKGLAINEWRKVFDLDPDGRLGATALTKLIQLGHPVDEGK